MELRGRFDRTASSGFKLGSGSADLISDIHRQHRRKVLRRAAQLTALAVALLLLGMAFKSAADSRLRERTLEAARTQFARGTVVDLREATAQLHQRIDEGLDHPDLVAALALARAQLWVEYGEGETEARAVIEEVEDEDGSYDAVLARGMKAFADGERIEVEAAIARARDIGSGTGLAPQHVEWLAGMHALDSAEPASAQLSDAALGLDRAIEASAGVVAYPRLRAAITLKLGDGKDALAQLQRVREQSPTHMGLAADEALYSAYVREELRGVADVADQLLKSVDDVLGTTDRAHALLARGVVHVHTGESKEGLGRLDQAWAVLPRWDGLARELALRTALEAGQTTRAKAWLPQTPLPASEHKIYEAWTNLARGDVMQALELLAKEQQEHPRVAYLQALALVEQQRFAEAAPWIDRAETLWPGRVEIEIARARVEVMTPEREAALRKLEALAEEEPYAPRAWTGLGEAALAQAEPDFAVAKSAFEHAIEHEPVPAEAMLRLAQLLVYRREKEPEGTKRAGELFAQAAKTNPHLPRYREAYGSYLADIGRYDESLKLLRKLADEEGVHTSTLLKVVELSAAHAGDAKEGEASTLEAWLDKAEKAGATDQELELARCRILVASGEEKKLTEAKARLNRLLGEQPGNIEARVLFARVSLRMFDRDAAEDAIRRGLKLTPDKFDGRLNLAWAELESRTGKIARAAAHARTALRQMLAEGRPDVELLEAGDLAVKMWLREGQQRVAMQVGRDLASALPYQGAAWTIRAAAELAANESSASCTSIERALTLDRSSPRTHELHGHCLLRFGHKEKARVAYEKAIELAAGTENEKALRDNLRRL